MVREVLAGLTGAALLLAGATAGPVAARPNPPQGVTAQAAGRQLTIGWLVLSDDGWGGPVDNYQVTLITPGGDVRTAFSATSPVTFTGLRHGTYSYYLGAHNADGWGHVTPTAKITVPSEPDRMAVPRASSVQPDTLTVTWTPPGSDGESPITGWQVRFDGAVHDVPADTLKATFPAPGGTTHTVQVRAGNAWGYGDFSGTHYAHALGTPGPVPAVKAVVTDSTVTVTWTPPDNDGGRPIDHYRVRVFSGSYSQQASGTDRVEFAGLRPDSGYTVSVAPVGYDPSDGLGILTGPAYKIPVHTKPGDERSPSADAVVTPSATKTLASATPSAVTSPAAATGSADAAVTAPSGPAVTGSSTASPAPSVVSPARSPASLPASSGTAGSAGPGAGEGSATVPGISGQVRNSTVGGEGVPVLPGAAGSPPRVAGSDPVGSGAPAWLWWVLGVGAGAVLVAAGIGMLWLRRRDTGQPARGPG